MTVVCTRIKPAPLDGERNDRLGDSSADCCYRVEGDSMRAAGADFLEGSDEPVQVSPGTVLETWLRTFIDLCNDSRLTQDERSVGITGGPTEGRLKCWRRQLRQWRGPRLVAKIPLTSQYKIYVDPAAHRWQCPGC